MSKFDKNTSEQDIRKQLRSEGWSDKRIESFLRGWRMVSGK